MDVTPLRESRDFRLLFTAGTVFYLGGMVSYVAIPFQIYDLTGSNFLVGAVARAAASVILAVTVGFGGGDEGVRRDVVEVSPVSGSPGSARSSGSVPLAVVAVLLESSRVRCRCSANFV